MLIAWLPLLVALLVGLPSTVRAQTLDHQQLDISGALATNPSSPGDFDDKHLSKHPSRDTILYNNPKMPENALNSSFPCPEPTDIAPCVCTVTETYDLRLDCSAVESLEQLSDVFRHDFPVKHFNQFWIDNNSNIQYLADIFNGVSFTSIQMNNVLNLREISKFAFFDSKYTLEILYIYCSALDEKTFPFRTLNEFPKLSSLTIAAGNIYFWPVFVSSSMKRVSFYEEQVYTLPAGKK